MMVKLSDDSVVNDLEKAHSPMQLQGPRLYVLHWTVAYRLTLPYEFDSQRPLACKHKQLRTKLQ